jgi:hypothetical protein
MIKKFAHMAVTALVLGLVPAAFAQNHGEVGVFADYFKLESTNTNNLGIGGRLGINVLPIVQLEGELAYDFSRGFNTTVTPTGGGTTVVRSNVRILHGLFGPKLQTGGQAIRAFATLKGGFVNFDVTNEPATFGAVFGDFDLGRGTTRGVLYPGVGVEFYAGPFGLRFDVGDEIYFADGAHNNLRVSAGPHIRF